MVFNRRVSTLRSSAFVGVLALGVLAACRDSTSPGTMRPLKLSFSTQTGRASLSGASDFGASRTIVVGTAGELVITKAQIVLDDIELSPSEGVNCNGKGENGCQELDHDAIVVDLPVVTGTNAVLTIPIAEGTYSELEAEIKPAERGIPGRPEFDGKSVRVEGTYKGAPFLYSASVKSDFNLKFNPPLVISSNSKNITVSVDMSKWFLGTGGVAIDPATAGVGGVNAALLVANIKASFRAFRDDNERGDDR